MTRTDAERLLERDPGIHFSWGNLTSRLDKAQFYAWEPQYRETLYESATGLGLDGEKLAAALHTVGLGIFRPDAIAAGKVDTILDYYARLGMEPFFAAPLTMTRTVVREIWRYQLNAATGELLKMFDLLYEASPAVLALFRTDPAETPVPCSVLMADAKGRRTHATGRAGNCAPTWAASIASKSSSTRRTSRPTCCATVASASGPRAWPPRCATGPGPVRGRVSANSPRRSSRAIPDVRSGARNCPPPGQGMAGRREHTPGPLDAAAALRLPACRVRGP